MALRSAASATILFAFLSILTVAVNVSADSRGPLAGGWTPIKNPNDVGVVKIAKFAVNEYNKKEKKSLVFVSVVKGESQVVAGTNYKLQISAKHGKAAPKTYTAVVYSRVWEKYLELKSFVLTKA